MNRYYTIVTQEQLDTTLPDEVISYMGYDKLTNGLDVSGNTIRSYSGITLSEAHFNNSIELEDGRFLIGIQLCPPIYLKERCVKEHISENDLEMAKYFYGAENIISDISDIKIKLLDNELY